MSVQCRGRRLSWTNKSAPPAINSNHRHTRALAQSHVLKSITQYGVSCCHDGTPLTSSEGERMTQRNSRKELPNLLEVYKVVCLFFTVLLKKINIFILSKIKDSLELIVDYRNIESKIILLRSGL